MTKKPVPKKPAAKMPTIPRKKPSLPSVEDLMQELDAAVSDEEGGKTTAAASEPHPPEAKPSRPPHNLQCG
jgi:cell division protein FtsN